MSVWASIILAGGESRRMGQSKGLLPVKGEPLLKKLVRVVQPFSEHIIVVAREEEKKGDQTIFAPAQQPGGDYR